MAYPSDITVESKTFMDSSLDICLAKQASIAERYRQAPGGISLKSHTHTYKNPKREINTIKVFTDPADPRMRMPTEQTISIYLNDVRVMTVQGSPFNLEELGVGLLLSEGFLTKRELFNSVVVDRRRHLVYVSSKEQVSKDLMSRERIITSGCGTGETFAFTDDLQALDGAYPGLRVKPEVLLEMMSRLSHEGTERNTTGGVHGCALANSQGIIAIREDIGRHNAIDKLLGYAWLHGVATENLILVSTGRISYEMAIKAARSKMPLIVSRHGITTQAADIAKALGITAVSYCRGSKMTVLSYPERIILD